MEKKSHLETLMLGTLIIFVLNIFVSLKMHPVYKEEITYKNNRCEVVEYYRFSEKTKTHVYNVTPEEFRITTRQKGYKILPVSNVPYILKRHALRDMNKLKNEEPITVNANLSIMILLPIIIGISAGLGLYLA